MARRQPAARSMAVVDGNNEKGNQAYQSHLLWGQEGTGILQVHQWRRFVLNRGSYRERKPRALR